VSSDQFGEQTTINKGKSSLKGMTLIPELVSEWINAYPITVHVADRVDYIYSHDVPAEAKIKKHKEELPHRQELDNKDRKLVCGEFEKIPTSF
jgi:hypothetical protein